MNESILPPRHLGTFREINLRGYVFPIHEQIGDMMEPLIAEMGGTSLYLCVFSSGELLKAFTSTLNWRDYRVKKIDEHWGFLNSIPGTLGGRILKIAVDPIVQANGRVKFAELARD